MGNLKQQFIEATEAIEKAKENRVAVSIALCEELLKANGVAAEQTVKVKDIEGKEYVGVFRIVETEDSAVLRFFVYKKDATLSKQPKVFTFGVMPELHWNYAILAVAPCDAPVASE